MNRAQKKQANLLRPTDSANSLKSDGFASGFPPKSQAPAYYGLSVETLLKMLKHDAVMYRIAHPVMDKTELIQTEYILKKERHVLEMCTEKLKQAATIVHETEKRFIANQRKVMDTTDRMNEIDKELMMYEANIHNLLRPTDSANSLRSVGFPHNLLQGVAESNRRNFDQLTVDELIHLYWEVDESSISDEVENSYKNVDPLDSEFEFNPEFEF
jgi:hypothetical protein